MASTNCEEIQLARIAHAAGEESPISSEQVQLHIASCESCRTEIAQLTEIEQLLSRQTLRDHDVDLWTNIRPQLGNRRGSVSWQPFAVVAALLATFKLLEMAIDRAPLLVFNLAPLLLMLGLFIAIKENPFRINSNIALEK